MPDSANNLCKDRNYKKNLINIEIKNIIIELKNSFRLIYQRNTIKERINENENSTINITQIKTKEKIVEKKETQHNSIIDKFKWFEIIIIEITEEEKGKSNTQLSEVIVLITSKIVDVIEPQILEDQTNQIG